MKKYIAVLLLLCIFLSSCAMEDSERMEAPTSATEDTRPSITLAVFGDGYYQLEYAARRFNNLSNKSDYKVEIVDYCEGGTSIEQAVTRLNSELGAASGPDMIAFIDDVIEFNEYSGINFLTYMARDMLADMNQFIETDEDLNKDTLVNYKALNSYGGVYVLSNGFRIDTTEVLEETFGKRTGWSIKEYLDMEASLEPWQSMSYRMDSNVFLDKIGGRYTREAIDWENGSCDFNNPEFVALLEAAGRVKEDDTDEFETLESFTTSWQRLASGQLIMGFAAVFTPIYIKEDEQFTGKPLTFIGWPTPDGSCGSDLELLNIVGISAGSDHKEACWEFIKNFVMNPDTNRDTADYLPLYRPALVNVVNSWRGRKDDTKSMILTPEDANKLYQLIETPERLSVYDETVVDIIIEEAEEYFAGNRTAEDAAARVQERVSLYVAEQS